MSTDQIADADTVERYHIPAPGRWVWDGVLANVTPGHQATWVDYRNDDRAPLLFIAGRKDHIMPAAVNKRPHVGDRARPLDPARHRATRQGRRRLIGVTP